MNHQGPSLTGRPLMVLLGCRTVTLKPGLDSEAMLWQSYDCIK
ncbi:hypothetical protein J2848_005668 [Azospirillum lipoferum]|nr:hypothetical protein [Azospirillum lipoferum]